MIGLFIYLISYPRSLSIHTAPSLLPVLVLFLFSFFPSLLLSPLLLRAVSSSISELCSHLSCCRGRKETSFIDAASFSVSHSLRPLFIYLFAIFSSQHLCSNFFHVKLSQPSCASCFWANPVGGLNRYSCSIESLSDLDWMADCIKMKNGLRSHSLPLPRLLDARILAMLDVLQEIHVNTHKSFFMEYIHDIQWLERREICNYFSH